MVRYVRNSDAKQKKPGPLSVRRARILQRRRRIDLRDRFPVQPALSLAESPATIAVSGVDETLLKKIKKTIDAHLDDPDLNVGQLARQLYMNRSTLYRKIVAITGQTPHSFIKSCRLERAAALLEKNSVSVLEVALDVGFSCASYFTKCFKKKFRRLPSAYQSIKS